MHCGCTFLMVYRTEVQAFPLIYFPNDAALSQLSINLRFTLITLCTDVPGFVLFFLQFKGFSDSCYTTVGFGRIQHTPTSNTSEQHKYLNAQPLLREQTVVGRSPVVPDAL